MPFVKANGVRLYYETSGAGRPLLLVQGLGYDHRPYFWLAEALKKDFRVVLFDNRGVGRSGVPPGPYSIEQMADDAAALLDRLGIEKASVLGVSLGGYIAQMLALRHPQRVERLIIGCSFFSGDPEKLMMPREAIDALTLREGTPEEIARRGLAVAFSKNFPPKHPDIFEQLVRWRVELPVTAAGYFAQLQAGMGFEVEKRIGSVTGEVLILHGDLDGVVFVERGCELHEAVPGSKLEILEGCGHLFFIEQAEATARLVSTFVRGEHDRPGAPAPEPGSLVPWHPWDLLARRAALSPQKLAVTDEKGKERRTYAGLDERAGRLAFFLAGLGVRKGHRVGALSLNAPAMVEILYACGKLGAVFTPLSYRLGAGELGEIVADASPSVFFFDGANAPLAASLGDVLPPESRTVALDKIASRKRTCLRYWEIFEGDWRRPSGEAPRAPAVTSEDPWIICYTGGTTGRPKGALLTHGSVFWNGLNTIIGWGLREDDVAPVFTPLFHTGGLNVLLTPLLMMGGTCVLVPAFDAGKAFALLRKHRATYVFMVPSMYRMMAADPQWEKEKFSRVREFVTGGAPCPRSIFEAFAAKRKRFRMGYGLTEAGPNNFHIDPAMALDLFGSVGKPLPFVQARVAGEEGGEAGPGEVGELQLRGGHLFAGYWNRPRETAEAFAGGWLRTGDLARRDSGGNYAIAGRKKEMFISGGENVFPSEVEEAILRHGAVQEAAVVGVPDEKWGEVGLAAVALRKGASLTADELRGFLRDRIAHYKVPKKVVFMEELPKTGAGKIDKPRILKDNN
jgi:fatty-acyl-CoA synthase